MIIPIIIICYNNYKYVENTINQLIRVNKELEKNIIILDNNSTHEETKKYLASVKHIVFHNKQNIGPWISNEKNKEFYDLLPNKFILTDPDLEFNPNLPNNFIEILNELSEKYNSKKIGFALDISDYDKMYSSLYFCNRNIKDWESQWWVNKIQNHEYELYRARIDTTFALITKNNSSDEIRVAGNFTAKHIPWYIDNKVYNLYENFIFASNQTSISTISKVVLEYIKSNFIKIEKNNEIFFIRRDDTMIKFWEEYSSWQNNLFLVLENFLDKNKNFIEIGSGVGEIILFAARKSKHVYSFEDNHENFLSLSTNCKNNILNYTLKNNFSIPFDIPNIENTSLIKVDIRGGEENILDYLFKIHTSFGVPLLISFYFSAWQNKNIDRFKILNETQKNKIKNFDQTTLIFVNQT